MKLDWRTGAALLPSLLVAVAGIGFVILAFGTSERQVARFEGLQQRLEVIDTLDATTSRYLMRVVQALHLGRDGQAELRAARLDMERGFARLGRLTRALAAAVQDPVETRIVLSDVENTRRMLELFHTIDQSAARALVLQRDGQSSEALDLYRREVEFRTLTELAALLTDAHAGQLERLESEKTTWQAEYQTDLRIAVALGALLLVTLLGAFLALSRRPKAPDTSHLLAEYETRAAELREANRRLKDIDARRSQFLADVSHELRTPLTILRGEADVALLANSKPADQRRALEAIQDQAADLGQLLDDLLAVARSDADQQPLSIGRVLLDEILETATQEGETLAEPREITLLLRLADAGVWVDADMRRIKQAVLIGIDNAINHSPPGETVEVTLAVIDNGAQVQILDRGQGIAEADTHRVFDRFYRGRNYGNATGLGIGLAIARAIVVEHGGSIALGNREGGGAVLTMVLPLPKDRAS